MWQLSILTAMEYLAMMLIICKAVSEQIQHYVVPILLGAIVYVGFIFLGHGINMYITSIPLYVGLVFYVKMVFNKKMSTSIIACLIGVFMATIVLKMIPIVTIGVFLARPMSFTIEYGLAGMTATMILTVLCYLCLPIKQMLDWFKKPMHYLHYFSLFLVAAAIIVFLHVIYSTMYFDNIGNIIVLINIYTVMGIATTIAAASYTTVKFVRNLIQRNDAQNRIMVFRMVYANRKVNLNDHNQHLEFARWLSWLDDKDSEHAIWYIRNHLDNFYDEEDIKIWDDSKPNFMKLKNKELSIYLFAKRMRLRDMGVKCDVNIYGDVNTSKV